MRQSFALPQASTQLNIDSFLCLKIHQIELKVIIVSFDKTWSSFLGLAHMVDILRKSGVSIKCPS
jgi:hypothetical protein